MGNSMFVPKTIEEKDILILLQMAKDNDISSLTKKGDEINIRNNDGMTALMYATKYSEILCIQNLLCAGADPNIRNNDG